MHQNKDQPISIGLQSDDDEVTKTMTKRKRDLSSNSGKQDVTKHLDKKDQSEITIGLQIDDDEVTKTMAKRKRDLSSKEHNDSGKQNVKKHLDKKDKSIRLQIDDDDDEVKKEKPDSIENNSKKAKTELNSKVQYVRKRSGNLEEVDFSKVQKRLQALSSDLDVDINTIAKKVISGIFNKVTTVALDELAEQTSFSSESIHPDYEVLAKKIVVSNLHKCTKKKFSKVAFILYHHMHPSKPKPAPLLAQNVYEFIQSNSNALNNAINHTLDYTFGYMAIKTVMKTLLFKINNQIIERPQHFFMRVSCGIHCGDIDSTLQTYYYMSNFFFIHASPTLYHAGTPKPSLSSCFLLEMENDSIEGIYETLKSCALISQRAGGIGLACQSIRVKGSYIEGANAYSDGLIPFLTVFNSSAKTVNQGMRRKGAISVCNEPWHADIYDFLNLKKNHGDLTKKTPDLFLQIMIEDEFLRRVENDEDWSLFCPDECPGLDECYGDEFVKLYKSYELQPKKIRKTVKARHLWNAICIAQIETGVPYQLYKTHANSKNNQKNLGCLKLTNLCTEIFEYTSKDEIAVCNLASIALGHLVQNKIFNFELLEKLTRLIVQNIEKIIDINYYPTPKCKYSNINRRPMGIGVQGLADCFILMRYPWESKEAQQLNIDIFETMYYAACCESCELSKKIGPYNGFHGSPISQGKFQFDLWGVTPSTRYNWEQLRQDIMKYGVRHSLLIALMPTVSTSIFLGQNECFEPYTSNYFVRRTLTGDFHVMNKHLVNDLIHLKLWNEELKEKIVRDKGSIQKIDEIPKDLKDLYKTIWEIKSKTLIDYAADRGPFICQSQSLNCHMENITIEKLTAYHFYCWKKGLKTGMYYLRSKAAVDPVQVTITPENIALALETPSENVCKRDDPTCESCGS